MRNTFDRFAFLKFVAFSRHYVLLSWLSTFIQVDIYAGGLFLKNAVGLNIYVSSAALLSFTAIYTLLGMD